MKFDWLTSLIKLGNISKIRMIRGHWVKAKGTYFAWRQLFDSIRRCGVMVMTTEQLHSTKSQLRFCARVGYSQWWGSLNMAIAGNKAKQISLVNQTTKTIHHEVIHCKKLFFACHFVLAIFCSSLPCSKKIDHEEGHLFYFS